MHKLPNLLKSRHGVYYLRLYVDSRELKRSLGTKDFALAKLRLYEFQLQRMPIKKFEVNFAQGIFKADGPEDAKALAAFLDRPDIQARMAQAPAASAPAPTPTRAVLKSFSAAYADYLDTKKLKNTAKTLNEKEKTFEQFGALYPSIDTNHITKDTAVAFKNRLIKSGAGNSILNKRISFLKDFLDYAIRHGYYTDANPFLGLSVEKRGKNSISYAEFTDEELKKIFSPVHYLPYMKQPNYKWLPLLALFSGARISELAGLELSEIYQSSGVWVMYVPAQRAKTENSVREIPIHRTLVELGFLEYVDEARHAQPHKNLVFPELATEKRLADAKKSGEKIDFAKNCSRLFGEYLDEDFVKIQDRKKVFHSFRSTFINRLTNVQGSHPAHIMGIVGHMDNSKIDFSSPHFKTYQQKKPIELLKKVIDRLSYPFLDLGFLKEIAVSDKVISPEQL